MITVSGGEPLLHPDLDAIIERMRARGMIASLITNGYYLYRERIERLNRAGLDHLQISIDNVEPDEVSMKSLRLLEPKLQVAGRTRRVRREHQLRGGGRDPATRRTRWWWRAGPGSSGFTSTIGILHDGRGQLQALGEREMGCTRSSRRWAAGATPG